MNESLTDQERSDILAEMKRRLRLTFDGDLEYIAGMEVGVPVVGFDHALDKVVGMPASRHLHRTGFDHMWVINAVQCPVTLGASATDENGSYWVEFYLGVDGARRLARHLLHAADREDPDSEWSRAIERELQAGQRGGS